MEIRQPPHEEPEETPVQQRGEEYFAYGSGKLVISAFLCDACAFNWKDDPSLCRKYPECKP